MSLQNRTFPVTIGGSVAGAGNLISSNTGPGIYLITADHVVVKGNRIGTQQNGTSPLPNGGQGVQMASSTHDNTVGGVLPGEGNVIAYNAIGVSVGINRYRNSVRGNSIRDNVSWGIYLDDFQDSTAFAPLIIGVSPIAGTACPGCTVDVYSDAADEGATFHGAVVANGTGNWSFSGSVTGDFVTATGTGTATAATAT